MITGSTAILACSDVVATLDYYKSVLGFETSWTWGEPPSFGGATWNGFSIMFNLQPDLAAKVSGHQHAIRCEEVDKTYELQVARGANIVSPIEDKPWGIREYIVEDLNGYYLRFSGTPISVAEKSKPMPPGVRIVRRMPTAEEHLKIAGKEFYEEGSPLGALERTWEGVVALSPEGETIGMLRIMFDAPGWYSIWDVAVVPDWQGQHIGQALMKEALALVNETSPGSFVYLFTFKHGFYERLGFALETVSMRRA